MSDVTKVTWYNATGGSNICLNPTGSTTFYANACCDCVCTGGSCNPPIPTNLTYDPTGAGSLTPYLVLTMEACSLYGFTWAFYSGQAPTGVTVCASILCSGGVLEPGTGQCQNYLDTGTFCIDIPVCP